MFRKGASLAVVLLLGLTGCTNEWSRSQIDLHRFVEHHDPQWTYLNARDAGELCAEAGCVQAVRSDDVTTFKFSKGSQARAFAASCDCEVFSPLVLRYDDRSLTPSQRRDIRDTVANINAEDDLG